MTESIIYARGLVKTFPRAVPSMTIARHIERLTQKGGEQSLYALCDLDLEIQRGEWVGLVGNNGSGKTTLLKVVAGLYPPTRGTLRVNGKVSLLAGLGIGMVGALTVRENIFLYGALHGIGRTQLARQFEEILAWAELDEFEYAQFQTLSSGMRSRLAFSISRYTESEIHLQDEALTAGDKDFAKKCVEYYETVRAGDRTFMIAAHDLNFIERFCARTLWLVKGRCMAFGETADVLAQYRAYHR